MIFLYKEASGSGVGVLEATVHINAVDFSFLFFERKGQPKEQRCALNFER